MAVKGLKREYALTCCNHGTTERHLLHCIRIRRSPECYHRVTAASSAASSAPAAGPTAQAQIKISTANHDQIFKKKTAPQGF